MATYCAVCGAELQGRFCSSCGKDSHVNSSAAKEFWSYLYAAFLSWDSLLIRTIRYLFSEPGTVISNWVNGVKSFLHPLRFVVIMAGLNLLAAHFTGTSIVGNSTESETAQLITGWMENKFGLVWILLIPFMAGAPFLIHRRSWPDYIAHLATVAYLTGINNLINVPLHLIETIFPGMISVRDLMGFGLPFLYGIWFYRSVFRSSWLVAAATMTLTFLFGVIGFLCLFILAFLILEMLIA